MRPEVEGPRILWTASRALTDRQLVVFALNSTYELLGRPARRPLLVHGDAKGGDQLGKAVAEDWAWTTESHSARDFPSPRARNAYMVSLGADLCATIADRWASGTGMCARMARRAGIPTFDFGVDTRIEARP